MIINSSFSGRLLGALTATVVLALTLMGFAETDGAKRKARPNIVFFLADDFGYMDMGANNPVTWYETPNIDSIAARGMKFTDGYAACPVCSPTRASIMTGKYPARVGITDFIGKQRAAKLAPPLTKKQLSLEEVTLAEALRDAGYTNYYLVSGIDDTFSQKEGCHENRI